MVLNRFRILWNSVFSYKNIDNIRERLLDLDSGAREEPALKIRENVHQWSYQRVTNKLRKCLLKFVTCKCSCHWVLKLEQTELRTVIINNCTKLNNCASVNQELVNHSVNFFHFQINKERSYILHGWMRKHPHLHPLIVSRELHTISKNDFLIVSENRIILWEQFKANIFMKQVSFI